ncbi:MAG TPA: DNA-binding domain-containing protein [Bryobacteraceae bacterium]|nr:DNA-binding domain-containing protein [Bryobacteraceae bacterium]
MSNLHQLQKRVAALVMQPLTRTDGMRRKSLDGRAVNAEAQALIKPNRVLSSFERLEIYNRQYWFRVLSSFAEDFPGLRTIVGTRRFERLMRAYLSNCPSQSFTLRNLGSRLEEWLGSNPQWIAPRERLALDMVRLEWAHIEAFDGGYETSLTPAEIRSAGLELRVSLQPYIRLLELTYPVDDLLIEVHDHQSDADISSNAARQRQFRRRIRHHQQPEPERIYLAVHRMDDSVYYKRLQLESFRMLNALNKQKPLEQAIDIAFENSPMPDQKRIVAVQRWFGNWAELGWFCRSKLKLVRKN